MSLHFQQRIKFFLGIRPQLKFLLISHTADRMFPHVLFYSFRFIAAMIMCVHLNFFFLTEDTRTQTRLTDTRAVNNTQGQLKKTV